MRFLAQTGAVLLLIAGGVYFSLARTLLCGNDLADVTAVPASNWEVRMETYIRGNILRICACSLIA